MRASAASRRSPSSPSGTATRRWSPTVTPCSPRQRSPAPRAGPGWPPATRPGVVGHPPPPAAPARSVDPPGAPARSVCSPSCPGPFCPRPRYPGLPAPLAPLLSRVPSSRKPRAGEKHGEHPAADDRRVSHVEDRPVRQLDPVHDITAKQPGERSSRSVRFPVAPPSSRPRVTAHGRLRQPA